MRIKCTISYDGTNFSGFQIQPYRRTVAGEIEKALQIMHKGEQIRIHGSGRTDAGVHAQGQVFHFDTALSLPIANWQRALNALLPDDLYVKAIEEVNEAFHARYNAVAKEYHYYVQTTPERDVFKRQYALYYPEVLNIEKMHAACERLQGTHDFTTFASQKATVKGSKERTLYKVAIEQERDGLRFIFKGNGFLYNMVRILVSVILDVGSGKISPEAIPDLIAAKDRSQVGKTMPAHGLYLYRVDYQ